MIATDAKIREISIADIQVGPNHRDPSREDVASLAASIERLGQLTPIMVRMVYKGKAKYALVYGHRRLLAMRSLKRTSIEARVVDVDERESASVKAVENVERMQLSALEEGKAVADLMDKAPADQEDKIAWVAEQIGRNERWVRDRAYLARLGDEGRVAVLEGWLPLGYAREIAKVGVDLQDELVDECRPTGRKSARGRGRHTEDEARPRMSLPEVKHWVSNHMRGLKAVPWELDVEFAGKPACSSCPFNSGNDRHLFDNVAGETHDPGETAKCLDERCFALKERAAEKAVKLTIDRVRKIKKKDRDVLSLAPAALQSEIRSIPKHVKPATLSRRLRKVFAPQKVAKPKKSKKSKANAERERRSRARQAYYQALRDHMAPVEKWVEGLSKGDVVQYLSVWWLSSRKDVDRMCGWATRGKGLSPKELSTLDLAIDAALALEWTPAQLKFAGQLSRHHLGRDMDRAAVLVRVAKRVAGVEPAGEHPGSEEKFVQAALAKGKPKPTEVKATRKKVTRKKVTRK